MRDEDLGKSSAKAEDLEKSSVRVEDSEKSLAKVEDLEKSSVRVEDSGKSLAKAEDLEKLSVKVEDLEKSSVRATAASHQEWANLMRGFADFEPALARVPQSDQHKQLELQQYERISVHSPVFCPLERETLSL